MRIAVIIGTRPEAIKMAPVVRSLVRTGFQTELISTGQHLELLRDALVPLELVPDHELQIMTADQTPNRVAAKVLDRMPELLTSRAPGAVLVQGDTTTAFAAAFAAYQLRIPVGHVEAGLRTYNHDHPFPEEANRQLLARVARWHFAPTPLARDNLVAERVDPARIFVTGNTAVDSLLWMIERVPVVGARAPYVLLTLHRRESFGASLRDVAHAVRDFLEREPAAEIRWPVHPNPQVKAVADEILGAHPRVHLSPALPYHTFAAALAGARIILTDSGGVQEEAPSLGKRVLVARETTERPEGVSAGVNRLVGRERRTIADALVEAWNEPTYTGPLPAPNPYGDGTAAEGIAAILTSELLHR